jgi:hypothetical protein
LILSYFLIGRQVVVGEANKLEVVATAIINYTARSATMSCILLLSIDLTPAASLVALDANGIHAIWNE